MIRHNPSSPIQIPCLSRHTLHACLDEIAHFVNSIKAMLFTELFCLRLRVSSLYRRLTALSTQKGPGMWSAIPRAGTFIARTQYALIPAFQAVIVE
jgi:hypothetical protein